jgi:hypothetical protein
MSTTTPKDLGDLGSGNEITRARQVMIDAPWNGNPEIVIRQEKFVEVGGVKVPEVRGQVKQIKRDFDTVKNESVTVGGVTVTVQQIYDFMSAKIDEWRIEDAS